MVLFARPLGQLDHGCRLLEDPPPPIQDEVVVRGHEGKGDRERGPQFICCEAPELEPLKAGLDLGIVNAGMLGVYEEIPDDLLTHVEDVLLNRRPDATDRLIRLAEQLKGTGKKTNTRDLAWREEPVSQRISHALIKGIVDRFSARRGHNAGQKARVDNIGVLLAAGLIAGEALIGLLFASLAMFDIKYNEWLPSMSGAFPLPFGVSLLVFGLIGWILVKFPLNNAGSPDDPAPPSAAH